MLDVLHNRNYALLWLGGLISSIGDWVFVTALPFYIYARTGSALASGLMLIAYIAPAVALGTIAGVFVDRWDRQRTMVICDGSRCVVILTLLLAHSRDSVWMVYVVAFAESAVTQFFTPARAALVPRLVGQHELMAANSLASLSDNVPRLLGPALGGALLSVVGLPGVVIVDSLSYLCSGLMIAFITAPSDVAPDHQTAAPSVTATWRALWRDWRDGITLVRRDRVLRTLFLISGTTVLADSIVNVLLVAFVTHTLHGGVELFGWLLTVRGAGGLAGGLLIGRIGRVVTPKSLLTLSYVVQGVLFLLLVDYARMPWALVVVALLGLPAVAALVTQETLLQVGVVDAYRGRVFGALGTTSAVVTLAGLCLGGAAGDRVGITVVLNGAGGLWILAGVLSLLVLNVTAPATALTRTSS